MARTILSWRSHLVFRLDCQPYYQEQQLSAAGLATSKRAICRSDLPITIRAAPLDKSRIVCNPEAIALRYFARYTQKWFSFDTSQKCLQRLFLGIDFRFSRAKGATHEALLFLIAAFCRRGQSLSC